MLTEGPKHIISAVADARYFGCRTIGTSAGVLPSHEFGWIETGRPLWEFRRFPLSRHDGRMGEIVDVVALESGNPAGVFPCF
jgi:hypothetical protein